VKKNRKEVDPPNATSKFGWRYHHLGIPSKEKHPGEKYIEKYKMYVSGFDASDYGIEWMRFEDDSPISDLIKTVPHIAFEVDNLELAIEGKTMIGDISTPSSGIRVAMILENGAPVELIEFSEK
jgi:hypothetical protein